jgi:hypothetical protein
MSLAYAAASSDNNNHNGNGDAYEQYHKNNPQTEYKKHCVLFR